ncbi:hypothetical protein [Leptolyngbya sp. 7M]|uniref:hypothetical protein n=1 Tax=Leptolyngbya sp. 7M TaxID=2812896 RepID=UPI001B8B7C21|nr:hypothetical protein [Leptolyngbya sp. 7M]QYO66617.1 hypothetical protein JVX88_07390 [Leptolyngbya sp. 7M]
MREQEQIRNRSFNTIVVFMTALMPILSCSIPSLEQPACNDARPLIREFYSFHFGNEMEITPEGIRQRERFLSPQMKTLAAQAPEGSDPFTVGSGSLPRAFRVGSCRQTSESRVEFDVLFFWKEEATTEQRPIKVELIKEDGQWFVERVNN